MGRPKQNIVHEVAQKISHMEAYGQSKHADKLANRDAKGTCVPDKDKIYSISTRKNYMANAQRFAKWARSTHGVNSLTDARQYTGEYLSMRQNEGKSAWTIRADAAAIAKVYGCRTTELGIRLPERHRGAVTQHRGDRTSNGHYSESNHQDIKDICQATGLRAHELAALKPSDVWQSGDKTYVHVRQGKGGKERIIQALNDAPMRYAEKAKAAGNSTVVAGVPNRAPCHAYRADFARSMYASIACDTGSLHGKQLYRCKGDMAGKVFDRAALSKVSRALGHARIGVVTHYMHDPE